MRTYIKVCFFAKQTLVYAVRKVQ